MIIAMNFGSPRCAASCAWHAPAFINGCKSRYRIGRSKISDCSASFEIRMLRAAASVNAPTSPQCPSLLERMQYVLAPCLQPRNAESQFAVRAFPMMWPRHRWRSAREMAVLVDRRCRTCKGRQPAGRAASVRGSSRNCPFVPRAHLRPRQHGCICRRDPLRSPLRVRPQLATCFRH